MASVTFFPQGTQLDNDEIADLQVNIGDGLEFSSILDTSGLDADLQSIKIRLQGDSTEFNPSSILTDFFKTTFPDVSFIEDNSDDDFTSVVLELRGEPGATPNTTNVLVESEATVLSGLVNDGETDIGVTVVEAIDANGNDVTDLFEPAKGAIDLQPSPQVQAIFGTEKSEPIIGTPQNDIIIDSEGNDTDFGDEGNDVFLDDTGNDYAFGGAGDDFVNIDSVDSGGDELIDLGTGNDYAFGGTGADTFVLNRDSGVTGIGDFTPGEDRFALGENLTEDDLNFAQLDNDSLGSLNGSTLISVADRKLIAFVNFATVEDVSNAEFISAEEVLPTDDSLTTGESSPEPIQAELPPSQSGEIFGTPNPDILVGDDGTNLILTGGDSSFVNAGGGDDLVFGEENLNIFNGEAGDDLLSGGVSEDDALGDFFSGGEGADTLLGQRGNDVLNGDDGNDLLVGGSGIIDALNGGRGDDLLFGGAGNDILFGNEGHDTFAFASGEEADIIFDFEPEQDTIALTGGSSYDSLQIEYNAEGNYTNISEETGELIATLIGVEADQLTESNFTTRTLTPDETTAIASSEGLQINGSDGNDRINGSDGNDIINSGNGDDTINSGAGDDTINGGRGLDILDGGAGTDVLALFALNRGDENIGFIGEADNFTFFVDGADEGTFLNIESVKFDNGEVVSTQDLDFTDAIASSEGLQINGSDGNDRINGSDGNDILNSNGGDDTLNGGKGDDTLNGGAGTDVLAFDFEQSENITYVGSANDFNVLVDSINKGTFTNIESIEFANGDVIATQDLDFA